MIISPPKAFGPGEVRALREELRLNRVQLGAVLGVSSDAIKKWETGVIRPSASACRLMEMLQNDSEGFFRQIS